MRIYIKMARSWAVLNVCYNYKHQRLQIPLMSLFLLGIFLSFIKCYFIKSLLLALGLFYVISAVIHCGDAGAFWYGIM